MGTLVSWKTGKAKHSQKACHNSQLTHEQLNPKQCPLKELLPAEAKTYFNYLDLAHKKTPMHCPLLHSSAMVAAWIQGMDSTKLYKSTEDIHRKVEGLLKAGPHPQKKPKSSEKKKKTTTAGPI